MFRAPSQLPPLSLLIDDSPTRCTKQLARYLGISERTFKRYQEQDHAPRLVMLALFWESRWGQSVLDCEIFNRDRVQRGLIQALQTEGQQLRETVGKMAQMLADGGHGAANEPFYKCPSGAAWPSQKPAPARVCGPLALDGGAQVEGAAVAQ